MIDIFSFFLAVLLKYFYFHEIYIFIILTICGDFNLILLIYIFYNFFYVYICCQPPG